MKIQFSRKFLAGLVIAGGFFGLIAAFVITTNKIELLKNPNFVPTCTINPWLDCGKVMQSKWGSLFGFPNSLIGLMVYALALWTGVILWFQKDLNPKFLKLCAFISGVGFVGNNVLTYISSSIIFSLCPWCLLAHTATMLVFFSLLTYLITTKQLFKNETKSEKWYSRINKGWSIWFTIGYMIFVISYVLGIYHLFSTNVITEPLPDPIFWLK
jgi:uncharacterized membrane protein